MKIQEIKREVRDCLAIFRNPNIKTVDKNHQVFEKLNKMNEKLEKIRKWT